MTAAGLALGGVCLALAGVIGLEALPVAAGPGGQGAALAVPAPVAAPDAPPIPAWAGTVLDRPIFAPDRRPPTAAPLAVAAPVALPRLAGTIATRGTLLAILVPAGGATVAVRHGSRVANWTVTGIAPGAVTLADGDRTATLRLAYADAPAAGPAPQPDARPDLRLDLRPDVRADVHPGAHGEGPAAGPPP